MDFRTAALALRDAVPNSYNLVAAADAIVFAANPEPEPLAPWEMELLGHNSHADHIKRVDLALATPTVIGYMLAGKKILAIKALRTAGGYNLKDAKEAVEDWRVNSYINVVTETFNATDPTHLL